MKKKHRNLATKEISPADLELLNILKLKYNELGRSPTTSEVPQVAMIKARFGLWKTALSAAGLSPLNDSEQQKLRFEEKNLQNHSTDYV